MGPPRKKKVWETLLYQVIQKKEDNMKIPHTGSLENLKRKNNSNQNARPFQPTSAVCPLSVSESSKPLPLLPLVVLVCQQLLSDDTAHTGLCE